MMDRHSWFLDIQDGSLALRCVCTYDPSDRSRPCWSHSDGEPDTDCELCVYVSWVENVAPEELLHGGLEIPAAVDVAWEGDAMVGHLRAVYTAGRSRSSHLQRLDPNYVA